MKRFLFIMLLLFAFPTCACAQISAADYCNQYAYVLTEQVSANGVYTPLSGTEKAPAGVVRAELIQFTQAAPPTLLIAWVNTDSSMIQCDLWSVVDGIHLTDRIQWGFDQDIVIKLVTTEGVPYLATHQDGEEHFYTVSEDALRESDVPSYEEEEYLIGCQQGQPTDFGQTSPQNNELFDLIKSLQDTKLASYTMPEADIDKDSLKKTLSACADVFRFDKASYDPQKFTQYVLASQANFQILTPLSPAASDIDPSISDDFENIKICNGEYVDWVLKNIFGVEPYHAPVNNLYENQFCYSGQDYYYTVDFGVYFETNIEDILAVYDLGNETYYTVFEDTYTEDGKTFYEYSQAVVRPGEESDWQVLYLSMGGNLLEESTLEQYAEEEAAAPAMAYTPAGPDKSTSSLPVEAIFFLTVLSLGISTMVIGLLLIHVVRN